MYCATIKSSSGYSDQERRIGSPGYDLEREFNALLQINRYVESYNWLSCNEKTVFDFQVSAKSGSILIDVVGFGINNGRLQLNTAHKNIMRMLEYAKYHGIRYCYIAFNINENDIGDISSWRFIKVKEDMPSGNLYISKNRSHSLKTADFIFRDKRQLKTILSEKVLHNYALRPEKDEALMTWIYST